MNPATRAVFDSLHARSLHDPEGFWGEAAEEIDWLQRWDRVLDDSRPPFYRWFRGGQLNTCQNAVDRHVDAGRGGQAAIIHDSPVTGTLRTIRYGELHDLVSRLAGVLRGLGVEKGDRVIIYMPMIPEALIAMLATARLGAVHSVVFGGFAPHELATRISDAQPRVIVSASCGVEPKRVVKYKPMLDAAIEQSAHKPRALRHPSAAHGEGVAACPAATWTGMMRWPPRSRPIRFLSTRPIPFTSFTPPAPRASRRELSATMAGTPWPSSGR